LALTNQVTPEEDSERWVSYSIDDLYPDWQQRAHCRGVGVSYYFGDDDEQPTMSIKQVRRAAKLCEVCPVYIECLTWALTTREEYGVWAGTSGRVRRRIFKLVDNGHTTVAEVVERFRNGQGDTYRLPGKAQEAGAGKVGTHTVATIHPEQGALGEGASGLRAVARREVAL
jgi:WhiB family transcriptional regulator, redox-sensing transcriptional regulator